MSITITLSNDVAEHLNNLTIGSDDDSLDEKLRLLLSAEYHRRLARYRITDQQLTQKYGMTFEVFEQSLTTKRLGYSWEAESDAIAWETAEDGIRTVTRKLASLAGEESFSDE